jgi:hypothetical protein
LYFHSNLVAVPTLGFGVFVSTNTDSGVRLAAELPGLLLQHYFQSARPAPLPLPGKDAVANAKPYAGKYLSERRNHRHFEKLLTASNAVVGVTKDGYLTLSAGGETSRWVWEKPDVFRAVEGPGRLAFVRENGAVAGFVSPYGHDVYDRVGAFGDANTLYLLLALSALVSLGVLTGMWLRRRATRGDRSAAARYTRWLGATGVAWLLFAALFAASFGQIASAGNEAVYTYPTSLLRIALWLAPLPALLSLIDLALLWPLWRAREAGLWRKLRHTLAVLAFAITVYAMWVWNVFGWKL